MPGSAVPKRLVNVARFESVRVRPINAGSVIALRASAKMPGASYRTGP